MERDRRQHPRREQLTDADQDRVAEVFTTHQRFIESVARVHAPAPDHVPDIVQSVGVQICRGLNGFRGDAEIRTWLYRVTVNTARDHYRKEQTGLLRAREAMRLQPHPDTVLDPDEQVIAGERAAALAAAVEQLRDRGRHLMRDEMAGQHVQLDQKGRSRRWRARQQLRVILERDPRLT